VQKTFDCTDLWKVLGYLFDVSALWSNDKPMQPAVNSNFIQHHTVCLHATNVNNATSKICSTRDNSHCLEVETHSVTTVKYQILLTAI